jgi:hypothetical protein
MVHMVAYQRILIVILLPLMPVIGAVLGFLVGRRIGRSEYRGTHVMVAAEQAKDLYRRVCNAIRQACDADPDESKSGTDFLIDVGPSVDLLPEPVRSPFYAWVDAAADLLLHPDRDGDTGTVAVSYSSAVESERRFREATRDAIVRYERSGR